MESFEIFLIELSKKLIGMLEQQGRPPLEPYIEVEDIGDRVKVTCELQGVSCDELNVNVGKDHITIQILRGRMSEFSHTIETKDLMKSDASVRFTNEILSITVPHISENAK